jgi:putative phosphoribosyl transferase
MSAVSSISEAVIGIDTGSGTIQGTLTVPERAEAIVVFAHGSGSSRHSPRNVFVAKWLHDLGLGTLLIDLLTSDEERVDAFTAQHRFDIDLLTFRLLLATDWIENNCSQYDFRIGYFGASTGAAAALKAAAERNEVAAVVSRGGRPDLAGAALARVTAATLLIVGGLDRPVIELNRAAYDQLRHAHQKELKIVPGATHLFEERGALEQVARLAGEWLVRYLGAGTDRATQNRATNGTSQTHSMD